jgi:hypothetical protein
MYLASSAAFFGTDWHHALPVTLAARSIASNDDFTGPPQASTYHSLIPRKRIHALRLSHSELKASEFCRTVTTVDVSTWHFVSNIQQAGAMSIAAKKLTDRRQQYGSEL